MSYHMRRHDRELKERKEIDDILSNGKFIVLSLCRDNEPYIVTLNYGYDKTQNCLYLHCANEGLKLDFIRQNPAVCATVIIDKGYQHNECSHEYETVVLRGKVSLLTSLEEKRHGLEILLGHLEADPEPIKQRVLKSDAVYNTVTIIKLDITDITGKKGR